jgi:hypothetical protein
VAGFSGVRLLTPYERLLHKVENKLEVFKFGRNNVVGNASPEDIWNGGGVYDGFLSTAEAVQIRAGGNANDAAAGTGARLVQVEGLDANGNEAFAQLTPNGTGASAASLVEFSRIFRAYSLDCGSALSNVGDVVIESSSTGTEMVDIPAELGQSLASFYTVPAGHTAALKSLSVTVEGPGAGTNVWMLQRRGAGLAHRVVVFYSQIVDDTIVQEFRNPLIFPAGTDLWFRAQALTGNSAVSADYELDVFPLVL